MQTFWDTCIHVTYDLAYMEFGALYIFLIPEQGHSQKGIKISMKTDYRYITVNMTVDNTMLIKQHF